MDIELPLDLDIATVLAQLESPTTPGQALEKVPHLAKRLTKLDMLCSVSTLAGLQTEPKFQANTIRLCWSTRLALALSDGDAEPTRTRLGRVLNDGMIKSGVARLEDPNEDFFIAPISTTQGDFRLFIGTWQNAAFYTETLLEAFERLPEGEPKTATLARAYELLKLSEALASRVTSERRVVGKGSPAKTMAMPPEAALRDLSRRVYFLWGELKQLDIDANLLAQYALIPEDVSPVIELPPGKSMLDYKPLLFADDGIVIASPANISTAIRAHLIDCATTFELGDFLQKHLLRTQSSVVSETRFVSADQWQHMKANGYLVAQAVEEISLGMYFHGIYVIDDFVDWEVDAFGTIGEPDQGLSQTIIEGAKIAATFARKRPGFKSGVTLIILGGWGRGKKIEFENDPELKGWNFINIEAADIPSLSGCEDGNFKDIWRIHAQQAMCERMGFEFQNLSGTLNLFQWWRMTDYALIPPSELRVVPPFGIVIPTDSLLEARMEGQEALDRRAVQHPDGQFRTVIRLDPKNHFSDFQATYAAIDAARQGRLLGVCLEGRRPVWVELINEAAEGHADQFYQTWRAALHWLTLVLPDFENAFGHSSVEPILLTIHIDWPEILEGVQLDGKEIDEAIQLSIDALTRTAALHLLPNWHCGLQRVDNRAEVGLAAAMLSGIALLDNAKTSRAHLVDFVQRVVKSPDIRWRHSFYAKRVIDALRLHGLIKSGFSPIPVSATSLAKCGSAFFDTVTSGLRIQGKAACFDFLMKQHDSTLTRLCEMVAQFDRVSLVKTALAKLHSALAEQSNWALTARAVRTIHGVEVDEQVSLLSRSQSNAVIRACSILAEVAASHSPVSGGMTAGDMDFDDLQALALLHFSTCELIPAIQGDRLNPDFAISPTGELLFNHEFGENVLVPSVTLLNRESRQQSDTDHEENYAAPVSKITAPDANFLAALEAEYRSPSEVFGNLSFAALDIAIEQGSDVFAMKRSEFIAKLVGDDCREEDVAALVDRMTLQSRLSWFDIPDGCHPRDFDLGRFDRRYSLIGRPIVAVDNDSDPTLVVAPGMIERALVHNVASAQEGGLQGEFWVSREMRSYVGSAGEKAGMDFNAQVAAEIAALGLSATPSVKPSACLNRKATDELKALGDIDVLAFSADGKHAWVVEAKNIKLCRTLAETAQRLSEYRGLTLASGKPDNLLRHLNRVAYVRAHAEDLAKRNRLPHVPKIHGLVVIDSPQPMGFTPQNSPDASFVRLVDIEAVPWTTGWTGRMRKKPADR